MLCFTFLGASQARIELCEEIIRYSAYREHGVHIGANLVVVMPGEGDRYLYAIHRRHLDTVRLAEAKDWREGKEDGFPYTFVFANIGRARLTLDGDDHCLLALSPSGADKRRLSLLVAGRGASVTNHIHVSDDAAAGVPFTCLRIGPFPDGPGQYLLRFECHIGGPSFTDLIPEDNTTATRIYKVYGPDHINHHIRAVDLPQAAASTMSTQYKQHHNFFESITAERMLLPERYGIIAVDNPNCNPARLRSLNLTEDLRVISNLIDPCVYEHPIMSLVKDRVHWFCCEAPTNSFYLQLIGPMALSELPLATLAGAM